ncbi:Bacterial type III secretion apparatus protein (OrgA MxiK) [Pseudomonas asplenii]|uniref:Bacterial type III secretion apparatus protein (OrgA MxiK) n=1 Tax=Pseudomonas asplenii TaxID=53407 RepID=A0A0N0VK09_9PSED|nr:protein OrgA [Pseudomonas fuscovaginae]KPA90796.1 Bacterial type III secretion apparatus protein (OrgA MxiK) [Pseudomonas fuscovaginae]
MSELDQCLRRILWQPLDYLAAGRLHLTEAFTGEPARQALNRILLEGLQLPMSLPAPGSFSRVWIRQWRHLPQIARLMGAQRLWPELARGARMGLLSAQERDFARRAIGPRRAWALSVDHPLLEQVEGVGLAELLAFSEELPAALSERVRLLFPETVVAWQARLPVVRPDPTLFFLAVQHVRHHS